MTLREYLDRAERGGAASLSRRIGVSMSYLSQMAAGSCSVSPRRCVEIEQATDGAVGRRDLRPHDWHRIWPELVEQNQ